MITFKFRRGTSLQWMQSNPILGVAEPGYETDSGKEKRGNGISRWSELPYFLTEPHIVALIAASVPPPVDGGTAPANLSEHVNSSLPHPIYDDGPSFLLLYQNAKV